MYWAADLVEVRKLLRQQKPQEAWQILKPLLEQTPDDVEALLLAGRIQLALDQGPVARGYLGKAAKLRPRLQAAQFLLGFSLYLDNDFKPALQALEKARDLKPDDGATLLYLALSYEGLADTEAALRLYPQAVKQNPSPEAPLAFARLLFSLGRWDEGQTQVSESLRRNPRSREAHYEQARLHFEQGRAAQAASSAELALGLEGLEQSVRPLHFLLARVYQKLGKPEEARRHREAFEAIPARQVR
jgi:tetratricopeptide (TPR) repeat protein